MTNTLLPPTLSDELLMAYADGQLDAQADADAASIAAVESAIVADAEIAAKVEAFMMSAALLQPSQARDAHEPNDSLAEPSLTFDSSFTRPHLSPANESVTAALQHRPAANQSWFAMVATVTCMAVGVVAYFVGQSQGGAGEPAVMASSGLTLGTGSQDQALWQRALSNQPSGTQASLSGSRTVQLLASVRDGQGRLCREFSIQAGPVGAGAGEAGLAGIACADAPSGQPSGNQQWQLQFAVATPSNSSYTPASSTQLLDAYAAAIGAGKPLAAQEEAQALAALKK
jgi:hypothetical protein